jgi:hypothetical protein
MDTVFNIVFGICVLLLTTSCSSESVKRNTYQSLQIMQQRECQQQPGQECPEQENYDKYQQQRKEELKK